jgi:hypothetical protein
MMMLFLGLIAVSILSRSTVGQTNLTQSGGAGTNVPPALADTYRLEYYYAAWTNSPAPGTESNIFTVNTNGTWNGDWNSQLVPAPSRSQLNRITTQQLVLFLQAGAFENGMWQIITSTTNIPLVSLKLTASTYTQILGSVSTSSSTP